MPRGQGRLTLEELLLRHGAIDAAKLERAREAQDRYDGDIGRALLGLGFITEELLMRGQAHQLGIRFVKPEESPPDDEMRTLVPVEICERFNVVPAGGDPAQRTVDIATSTPTSTEQLAELARATGLRIRPCAATAASIKRAIQFAYKPDELPELIPEPEEGSLEKRLDDLEDHQLESTAVLLARIERLEQMAAEDRNALNALTDLLAAAGMIPRK